MPAISVSVNDSAYDAMKRLMKLTKMTKSELVSYALLHLNESPDEELKGIDKMVLYHQKPPAEAEQ